MVSSTGIVQQFQGQTVFATSAGAVQLVDRGETGAAYSRVGAQTGVLGWPISAQSCGLRGNGCYQDFAGGSVHWSPTTGAHATSGAVRTLWGTTGWESGPLAYPKADAVTSGGVTTQEFQGGQIRVDAQGTATYLLR
ncbi:hypothetical protein DDQ50_09540 [Amnibacterium flavum]|uniref:LGFP repeat-containing protein n=1 Tax=Amnibacterium flavum TaxID=2173173 RepID=A0A2V1HQS9_9MICO|nr:hypothetical protein [Amnibacterium flavum]PVZ93992.1 hypothetical protein DDQ50_09540 [Amnibacterium flavum]